MRIFLFIPFLLQFTILEGQNTFSYPDKDDPRGQFSMEYSDTWTVVQQTERAIFLKIEDPSVTQLGLKLNVSGKVYNYDGSGFAMENVALALFAQGDSTLDSVVINGKNAFRVTSTNSYKKEERIIQDIFVDFKQYSTLTIHISGPKSLFVKYQNEIDAIINSVLLKEVRVIPPLIEITKESFEENIKESFQNYITEEIFNPLYFRSKITVGKVFEFEHLVDFFKWKRQSRDSLTRFEANNFLLYMDWTTFSKVDIDLKGTRLECKFFRDDMHLLTLETQLAEPILLNRNGEHVLKTFYIDYRPRTIIIDGKYYLDKDTGKTVDAPYMLLNGEVFPLVFKEISWY